jgi:glutaredoxin
MMENQKNTPPHLTLYHRSGCHLCEEARDVILLARRKKEFIFSEVDIESDLLILEKYRFDIPVIEINGRLAFKHRVTRSELDMALSERP